MSTSTLGALAARFPTGPLRYWVLLVAAGLSWGSTVVTAKIAVDGGHHPIGMSLFQALAIVALLGVRQVALRRRLPVTRRHLAFYAACGLLGAALPHTVSFYAAAHLPAGVLALILALAPMMTASIAISLGTERATALRLTGLAFGLAGIAMLILPEASLPDGTAWIWVLVGAVAPLSYACEDNTIDLRMPADCDAFDALLGFSLAAAAMLTPFVLLGDTGLALGGAWGPPEWSLVLMALAHLFAYATLIWLIGRAGPVFASQIGYVVTLSGVGWGMLILDERHSGWIWGALVLLMVGVTLVRPREDGPRG
jgi:drug/metabolite transporter (DMT)-like permease